ncbi:hypothetical protein Trydic_g11516 [Trypoxylus dichotomus]
MRNHTTIAHSYENPTVKILADVDHIRTESSKIKHIRQTNGFTTNTINRTFHAKRKIKGIMDKIGRLLRKHQIQSIFSTDRKIGQILNIPKGRIPLEAQGVYEIPCRNCNLYFMGQTNRKIRVTREGHKLWVRAKQSALTLAQQVLMTAPKIDLEKTITISTSERLPTRIIREAIDIRKRQNNLNKQNDAQRLPPSWRTVLKYIPTDRLQEAMQDPQNTDSYGRL